MNDIESFRAMSELVNSVILPIHETLSEQARAILSITNQIQRLAEMYQCEPTRSSVISEIRKELKETTDNLIASIDRHNSACIVRSSTDDQIDKHKTERILAVVEQTVKEEMKHVKDLNDKYEKIIWLVRIAIGLFVSMSGYIMYLKKFSS